MFFKVFRNKKANEHFKPGISVERDHLDNFVGIHLILHWKLKGEKVFDRSDMHGGDFTDSRLFWLRISLFKNKVFYGSEKGRRLVVKHGVSACSEYGYPGFARPA